MTDLLLVCLGATAGLRAAEDALAASLERAGASVARVTAAPPRELRTFMATDLAWALAARRAARAGLASAAPRAVLYSTTTAALLWPRPGAIRFDALAAQTRTGRHGIWQRPVEARRLRQASLLVPMTPAALPRPRVVVPFPVAPSGPAGVRDIAALTYGAHWRKKGLDRVLRAWARSGLADGAGGATRTAAAGLGAARRDPAAELVVTGVGADLVAAAWAAAGGRGPLPAGVRVTGPLPAADYRALLRRARVFVTAPRREDYGSAQLEALADGCVLVTSAAPGPYAALELARRLDPRLVVADGDDVAALAAALRGALATAAITAPDARVPMSAQGVDADGHSAGLGASEYATRAAAALAPYAPAEVDRVVAEELLPRLLG